MRLLGWISVLVLLSAWSPAAKAPDAANRTSPFAIVMIDEKTQKRLGPFPYDRSIYARAIEKAAESGVRGVVLKFFIDRPKTVEGDAALARAMTKTKVVLQARLDDTEPNPNPLPARFAMRPVKPDDAQTLRGNSGWIPIKAVADAAHDVGFLDHASLARMPLVECYRGDYVKSLFTCCLELAAGVPAKVEPGKSLQLGRKSLALDDANESPVEYPAKDDLQYFPLIDLLDGAARPELRDRVVIIGLDTDTFEPVQTPAGPIRPHRAFCYALLSLHAQLVER